MVLLELFKIHLLEIMKILLFLSCIYRGMLGYGQSPCFEGSVTHSVCGSEFTSEVMRVSYSKGS